MSKQADRRFELGPYAARAAAFGAILLGVALVLFVIGRSAGGTYEMQAVFDDVRGLIPGGEVTAGSLTVGTVTEVEFNDDYEPIVTFEVDERFPLYEGAVADIRLGSNVGAVNRVIALTMGDPAAPELEEGTILTGDQTDQPVNFDLAVETLDPATRANIKDFLIGLDDALKGRGDDFDRTLRHSSGALNETANLLSQVNSDGFAFKELISESGRITSALASSPDDLGAAVERTAELLAITAGRQAELGESIRLLGPALARGRLTLQRLGDAIPNLRELVAGLGPVVDALGPFVRLLPEVTDAAGPFLVETRKLVLSGPDDLEQLAPIISAADPVSELLYPVVRDANPLGQELRAYAPEVIGFFQNFGAAGGSYDLNGHLIRTAPTNIQTLPDSVASNTIDADDCGPGLLEFPLIRLPGVAECEPWLDYEDSFIGPGVGE